MAVDVDVRTAAWHARTPEQALEDLGSDLATRLDDAEAAARLLRDGPNALSWVVGEHVDALVILGVVVVNAGAGLLQESRAEAALSAPRHGAHLGAGAAVERPRGARRRELVQGDLVLLEAGDKVRADLRLVLEREPAVGESVLTGESVPAPAPS